MAKAMFGAGCFWGVESDFRRMPGVTFTATGYAGGHQRSPSYEQVCTGQTGHTEVVLVEYNPERVSYTELLDLFWSIHNPTHREKDLGTQYRSVIFYFDSTQWREAEASRERLTQSGKFDKPVATDIAPAPEFWMAEERHQQRNEKKRAGLLTR
jgi:peptide-methionine (S)-S-oxide reductase